MESGAINTAELLQVALESAGLGSWELYLSTGTVHRTARHDQIFGYSAIQPFWDLETTLEHIVEEDRAAVRQAFAQAKISGDIDVEARTRRAAGGETRWVHLTGRTFYVLGTPTRIVGVIADATHRRAVEDRLRQAQKIEALGQLTGGVAHDFNNLLQVISSGLQVVGRQADPARREQIFTAMRQAVDRGASLCRQLLAFSRRQALKPEAVNLERLAGDMRELLNRSLRGDIQIKSAFAERMWCVEVDPGELELVILNLAVNSRDAMPSGGTIEISARNMPALAEHDLVGDFVRLDIADSGVGMSPDVLAHAFEPFFTTKEVGAGSGLGLGQAHGFSKASGGAVRSASTPGHGPSVSLFLPRTLKTPAHTPDLHPSADDDKPNAGGQVLVVDDDDEVGALTVEMTTQRGHGTPRGAGAEAARGALADRRAVDSVFSD